MLSPLGAGVQANFIKEWRKSRSLKQDALIISVTDLDQRPEGPQMHEKPALTLKSASLRERLRLLNGEAYVEGQGSGAMLSIRIPMQQVEND